MAYYRLLHGVHIDANRRRYTAPAVISSDDDLTRLNGQTAPEQKFQALPWSLDNLDALDRRSLRGLAAAEALAIGAAAESGSREAVLAAVREALARR